MRRLSVSLILTVLLLSGCSTNSDNLALRCAEVITIPTVDEVVITRNYDGSIDRKDSDKLLNAFVRLRYKETYYDYEIVRINKINKDLYETVK